MKDAPQKPLILEIKGNSLDDGPGIRSVVFTKGCPLSCLWCHNPESKSAAPEIAFDPDECLACDTCLGLCPEGALSRDNAYFIDRAKCNLCFACVDACPSGALDRVGRSMGVDEMVAQVVRDKPFFDTSGGGVTLSGGEPTLFMDFTAGLLARLKDAGIHTLVETCGMFGLDGFRAKLYPLVDLIYFDLKIISPEEHKRYCGVDNRTILANFKALYQQYQAGGVEIVPRVPLIPGITDTEDNLYAIARFLRDCGASYVALMAYHPTWLAKNTKIGAAASAAASEELASFMPMGRVEACKEIFHQAGIRT